MADSMQDYNEYAASSKFTDAPNGTRLAYHSIGTGPAVLLLHGFPTWSWDWHAIEPHITTDRRLILPDFLGFGYSDKPKIEYSIATQADLILSLLSSLSVSQISIIAHDFGTIVVQELLRRAGVGELPVEVLKVSLLNGGLAYSAYRPTALQVAARLPLIGFFLDYVLTKSRIRKSLHAILGRERLLHDDEFEGLWAGIAEKEGQYTLRHLLRYNDERRMVHEVWESALAEFKGPVQLIWGLQDPVSGSHVLEVVTARLPNAEVVALDDVGHYPQIEAPERVGPALDRFLSR